jgi:hypothetical protein
MDIEKHPKSGSKTMSLAEALEQSDVQDFDFEPPRVGLICLPAELS